MGLMFWKKNKINRLKRRVGLTQSYIESFVNNSISFRRYVNIEGVRTHFEYKIAKGDIKFKTYEKNRSWLFSPIDHLKKDKDNSFVLTNDDYFVLAENELKLIQDTSIESNTKECLLSLQSIILENSKNYLNPDYEFKDKALKKILYASIEYENGLFDDNLESKLSNNLKRKVNIGGLYDSIEFYEKNNSFGFSAEYSSFAEMMIKKFSVNGSKKKRDPRKPRGTYTLPVNLTTVVANKVGIFPDNYILPGSNKRYFYKVKYPIPKALGLVAFTAAFKLGPIAGAFAYLDSKYGVLDKLGFEHGDESFSFGRVISVGLAFASIYYLSMKREPRNRSLRKDFFNYFIDKIATTNFNPASHIE